MSTPLVCVQIIQITRTYVCINGLVASKLADHNASRKATLKAVDDSLASMGFGTVSVSIYDSI